MVALFAVVAVALSPSAERSSVRRHCLSVVALVPVSAYNSGYNRIPILAHPFTSSADTWTLSKNNNINGAHNMVPWLLIPVPPFVNSHSLRQNNSNLVSFFVVSN
jgi:hypothetical protein